MPTIAERLETATATLEAAAASVTALIAAANRVDPTITSYAQLAAISTVAVTVPSIKIWRETATGISRFSTLLAGTDATDEPSGIKRPTDFNASTNAKVWYNS